MEVLDASPGIENQIRQIREIKVEELNVPPILYIRLAR